MFERTKAFFRWLTGKNKKAEGQNSKIAYLLKKGEKLPEGYCVCVFDGKKLVETADQVSSQLFKKGLNCWAVTRQEVEITLNSNGLETTAKVLLEPGAGLGNLLDGREVLSIDALQAVVQSQFAGFVGLMQGSAQALERLDDVGLEACCKKFNLLLASNGLKCQKMERFTPSQSSPAPVSAEEVDKELNEAIKPIHTAADWNAFSRNIQSEGFPVAWDSEEMSDLGKKYLDNRISSEECVRNIRQIAEEAAQAAKDSGSTDYWDGLAIRLRAESEYNDKEEEVKAAKPAPLNLTLGRSRRPKKGWFTRYISLDQKLQGFLKAKLDFVQGVLERERIAAQDIRIATEIRTLLAEIEVVQKLLRSTPVLDAKTVSLRVEKTTPEEMAKIMNQAVTAAEYLEAAVNSKDVFETFPLPYELKKSVAELKYQIEARYRTR